MKYSKPDRSHFQSCSRPRLAIPLGDPAGIGTEVVLKVLADAQFAQACDITVIGSQTLLTATYAQLSAVIGKAELADPAQLTLLDIPLEPELERQIIWGRGNAASGAISFRYLEMAIAHTLQGNFEGIVTAPIAKSAWTAAGHSYPGQTELLAERSGTKQFGMAFVARSPYTDWTLRTLLATTHIPLRQVPDVLTPELMTRKLDLLVDWLAQDFGIAAPKIAIAGLNPHSGEGGQLGREEQDWLIPWIQTMRDRWSATTLIGPVPPDTLWVEPGQAWFGKRTPDSGKAAPMRSTALAVPHLADAYLALYHDQGLIPVKLMAFDRAVNTSIGLPFVRTSPDHGTAFDIAGRGIADANSMKAAIALAIDLSLQRHVVVKNT